MGKEVEEEFDREASERAKRRRAAFMAGGPGKRGGPARMEESASRLLLGYDPTDEFLSSD